MAELDKTYYRGTDHYSDGDEVENRLLELARSHTSLDGLSVEEVSWPILYHLHPVRENICNWYPFRAGSRILEIGSGCGAITGALCHSGCEVCSVELSLRRATINYERHKDCENLRIIVGNLNDVAFDAPFDYVLLIGVLEYAGKYTDGEDPYRTFLENVRRYLKPAGRLLIAIENRLGLKYFSGAPEDHLGRSFAGLKGYDPAAGVKTFSHSELKVLLERSGFVGNRFYYPYPDYKFPNEIFTDASLSAMHYGKSFSPVDGTRIMLFPEHEVAELIAREGAAACVANAFFVEAALEPISDTERVYYVKQNTERDAANRLGTRIVVDAKGERSVYKYPLSDEAEEHIARILKNEETLGECRKVLRGERTPEGIRYPFLREKTVDAVLNDMLMNRSRQEVLRLIDDVCALAAVDVRETACDSQPFTEWFGEQRLARPTVPCACPANVDLILDNIFCTEEGYELVDCEWVTDFPVPVAFIVWRALNNTYYQYPQLEDLVPKAGMFERFGILSEDVEVYQAWSRHFEKNYVKNDGLIRYAKPIRMVEHSLEEIDYNAWRAAEANILEEKIGQLEDTLQTIQNSRTYRISTRLQRIATALIPEGSLRRKAFFALAGAKERPSREE